MSSDTRVRRTDIQLCEDCKCKFKQIKRGLTKIAEECALEKLDAIRFFEKYKVTTCEVGMGEKIIHPDHVINETIINKLKYKGRL